MKCILFLLFFLHLSAHASYAKLDQIRSHIVDSSNQVTFFVTEQACGENCVFVSKEFDRNFFKIEKELVNDLDRPKFSKNEARPCSGQEECQQKLEAAERCKSPIEKRVIDENYTETYCTAQIGFHLKESGREIVVEDLAKKLQYIEVEKARAEMNAKLERKRKDREFGVSLIDFISTHNDEKELSSAQVMQMFTLFEMADKLLSKGAIQPARDLIATLTPEGGFTQDDKTLILSKIDEYLSARNE